MWFAMAMGCYYTMCCWDPTVGIKGCTMANITESDQPAAGAPSGVEIVR
jgi:hypothetical protein|tara:strand:- start:474 stop:620 length:147 start_codon:yes stop_codon:yes gene_type:complete